MDAEHTPGGLYGNSKTAILSRIRSENFKKPIREDEYGTSVMSIQFTKDEAHTLSIKNRYNHSVVNPDATFSNNLGLNINQYIFISIYNFNSPVYLIIKYRFYIFT